MRILIIGGTGFIGPFVARQLHDQGHELLLYHRGQRTPELPPAIAHLYGDWSQLPAQRDAIRAFAPEVAIAMYAMTEEQARLIVAACRGIARRVVAISSVDTYRAYDRTRGKLTGTADPTPLTEDSPLRDQLYPYRGAASSLRAGEAWLEDYDKILVERVVLGDPELAGTVLRLPMTHGPGDGQRRFFPWLKRMDDGRPALLIDANMANYRAPRGYVENIAAAIALAATDERAAGRIYNVADDDLTEAEWLRSLGAAVGWKGQMLTLPPDQMPAHLRFGLDPAQHLAASSARIRRELGYTEIVPRDEGLRRTIAWERANPPATVDPAQFDYAAEDRALAAIGA